MPTYEYECGACGHVLEALQTMTEPKLVKCPACKKNKLHRLIGSGSGMIFKGTGFYETDYKTKTPAKSESKPDPKPSCGSSCPHAGKCGT